MQENEGYDGLKVDDDEYGEMSYVAFYANQIKSAVDNVGTFNPNNDDIHFSLNKSDDSDFVRAVDDIVAGKKKKGFVKLGTTPDVLKMLGVADSTVRISKDVIEKSMANTLKRRTFFNHTHSVTPNAMKELPKQLNNPIAVFKSSSVDGSMVVLTELRSVQEEKTNLSLQPCTLKQPKKVWNW